jgi:hypothetical protein
MTPPIESRGQLIALVKWILEAIERENDLNELHVRLQAWIVR